MADRALNLETLKSLAEAQSKIADARTQAIDAIQERSTLVAKIGELEEKLAAAEDWEADKQRYERKAAMSGAFFYALKAEAGPGEPADSLCAKCYQKGRKSVLEKMAQAAAKPAPGYGDTYHCPECLFDVVI